MTTKPKKEKNYEKEIEIISALNPGMKREAILEILIELDEEALIEHVGNW